MSVDIKDLSTEQLGEVRKQLEAEVEHLAESFLQLRQAQAKFTQCSQCVRQASESANNGSELLVPLSASLYVPGKMAEVNKFIVDIGTDYFVEKNAEDAVKFFNAKVETLNHNLVDLDRIVNEKMAALQQVEDIFKKKLEEAQKKQAQAAPGA